MNYASAVELLGQRPSKKVGPNTYLHWVSDRQISVAILFHSTDIIKFYPNGDTELNSGGWHTVTTKARMNKFLEEWSIRQEHWVWFVSRTSTAAVVVGCQRNVPPTVFDFYDGMVLHPNGTVEMASWPP